ncbi:MAG: type II secretion system F family protein [Eubacterium sp.]
MDITLTDIVMILIGYMLLLVWMFFFVKGKKNAPLFEPINEKDFMLKEIYFVGYEIMETINYKYHSRADRKLRQQAEILYGEKYADYFLRVVYAQKITLTYLVLIFSFIIYGFTRDMMIMFAMFVLVGVTYYYFGQATNKKMENRSQEMLSDFSEVVSKLALLTNAGMILKEAWEQTAYGGKSSIYLEMQQAVVDIENGMSEIDAYHEFGKRCMIPEIKKFSTTIIQGITQGNSELIMALQQQSKEVWGAKRQQVKVKGEQASSKLMMPMMLMFVGILIMVLVPIFANIGS